MPGSVGREVGVWVVHPARDRLTCEGKRGVSGKEPPAPRAVLRAGTRPEPLMDTRHLVLLGPLSAPFSRGPWAPGGPGGTGARLGGLRKGRACGSRAPSERPGVTGRLKGPVLDLSSRGRPWPVAAARAAGSRAQHSRASPAFSSGTAGLQHSAPHFLPGRGDCAPARQGGSERRESRHFPGTGREPAPPLPPFTAVPLLCARPSPPLPGRRPGAGACRGPRAARVRLG